ncbi:hypothetical protein QF035_008922 [Streptomyces umbrinus]|uniref:Uncharacterized protein n=1 Tax=Streptomyces umbrinus TaxID=67370 RepID=A0ABU0T6A4_9ACTN|nr:hypothetical protein [Streptomyces umbrinus]
MTVDELDPRKTDQRDRRTVEGEGAAGGDTGEGQAATQRPTAR